MAPERKPWCAKQYTKNLLSMTAILAFGVLEGEEIRYKFEQEIEGFEIPPILFEGMVLRFDYGERDGKGGWYPPDGGSCLRARVEDVEGQTDQTLLSVHSWRICLVVAESSTKEELNELIAYHRYLQEKK